MAPVRHPTWLAPDWDIAGVGALMTTRGGGISQAPYDSLNLRHGLGDDPHAVRGNQRIFRAALGDAVPVELNQIHGATVVRLTAAPAHGTDAKPDADASFTTEPGIACVVQVADCLPILFAAPGGRAVGAAHAGWRGLAAGVIEATLAGVCAAAGCGPGEVRAWLGACIGPRHFEVGADVLAAFGAPTDGAPHPHFEPWRPGKWLADLPGLARDRLRTAGAEQVSGGNWCTYADASRFFSFRRDGRTGRMAAAIWIRGGS
jgi:YfiH family protein